MQTKSKLALTLAAVLSQVAHAGDIVKISCTAPTARVSGAALSSSEIAGYGVKLNGNALATITGPACGYTYIVPDDKCLAAADSWQMSVTDISGNVSAASTPAMPTGKAACGPKSAPLPPSNVSISVTVSGAP